MFGMNWLKRRLKSRMQPIPQDRARMMVRRISMLYAFLGWNFVTILLWYTWKKSIPEGPEKLRAIVEVLDVDHARVITISGLSKVSEYDIDRTKEILEDPNRRQMITDLNPPVPKFKQTTEEFVNENSTGESSKTF